MLYYNHNHELVYRGELKGQEHFCKLFLHCKQIFIFLSFTNPRIILEFLKHFTNRKYQDFLPKVLPYTFKDQRTNKLLKQIFKPELKDRFVGNLNIYKQGFTAIFLP